MKFRNQRLFWVDKSSWGDGPWQKEPDKVVWRESKTGYACMARRHERFGHLCGYVGLPEGHPYFGKNYWSEEGGPDELVTVHGGLTYADPCADEDKERGICHLSDEKAWWFGFDCAHLGDLSPGLRSQHKAMGLPWSSGGLLDGKYRTLRYVQDQCRLLARQFGELT